MSVETKVVEAFMCPTCNTVSLKQTEIEKCVKKHNKAEELKLKEAKINKYIENKYIKVFKNNFIKSNPDAAISRLTNLSTALIAAAASFGQKMELSSLSILAINEDKIIFRVSGKVERIPGWKISEKDLHEYGILKKDFMKTIKENYHLNKVLNPDYSVYFSDMIHLIPGLDTRSGSSGGSSFHHDVDLFTKNFPDLREELKDFQEIKEKRASYNSELNRLRKEYEVERLPSVLVSDVEYAVMQSDLNLLLQTKEELLSEINILSSKLKNRKEILIETDSINIPKPDGSFDFNKEKFEIISKYLPSTIRSF